MATQITLSLIILVFFTYFWFKKRNSRLPPGPIRLPVLGSIIQLHLANPHYPHIAMEQLARKYGDLMTFGFGMHTAVVASSFESMKTIFQRADTNSNRFEFPYVPDRNYGKNLGIIWSHGKTWIDVRSYAKKILKEFGYGKVKIMGQSLLDSANQLVDGIKMELLDSTDGFFSVESHKFSIHVMNVLWSLVGGYKFDSNDILLKRNMECVDKAFDIIGHRNLYNMFPFLKNWFPKQVNYPQHLELHREIHDFTKILINDARERRSQRLDSDPISFIEEFLDKIEEHEQDTKTIFTQEQLEIILEDLFFGGLETTGTFLTWSILYLVQNLDVQTKFRKEVLAKMKDRTDLLQTIDLKKIPYVKATVLEILRMGNVVPTPLPRCATQDIEIKEFTIPKGTILFYNLHALYNDKKYWNDPETFMPERFIDEKGEIDAIKSERILSTVFGMGPRVCFGEAVAIDSLFMFLAALILNFKFEIIPGCEPSAKDPVCGLCVCPRKFKVKVSSV